MAYNGYTNEATYTVDLLVSNERKLYFPTRAIVMEHGGVNAKPVDAKIAAQQVRALVLRTLNGQNDYLSAEQRAAWRADIARSGGLGEVNWVEIAETQGEARTRPKHPKGRGQRKGIVARLTRRNGRRRYRSR